MVSISVTGKIGIHIVSVTCIDLSSKICLAVSCGTHGVGNYTVIDCFAQHTDIVIIGRKLILVQIHSAVICMSVVSIIFFIGSLTAFYYIALNRFALRYLNSRIGKLYDVGS